MKYQVMYNNGTRIRVRSGQAAFTKKEGYGIYLLNGIHMLKDTNEERKVDAIKVIKDSAKYGSVRALVLLGYLYEKGITVTQNNSVANEYYNLAIENGS